MVYLGYLRITCRLASLFAYGLSFIVVHHVQPIAAKAYDDLCSSQGVTFGDGHSVRYLCITMLVFALPTFLARSNTLIVANLILALATILGAISLLHTAGNIPYECFTTMGLYEDHTSGLEGFDFWLVVAAFLSYVLLLIDLVISSVSRLILFRSKLT